MSAELAPRVIPLRVENRRPDEEAFLPPGRLDVRAREVLALVEDELGLEVTATGVAAADQLEAAVGAIVDLLAARADVSRRRRQRCALHLAEMHELRGAILRDEIRRLRDRQDAVREALARLRGTGETAPTPDAVVRVLVGCGFTRAWFSRVDGSALEVLAGHGPKVGSLPSGLLPVVPGTAEGEAIRRRQTRAADGCVVPRDGPAAQLGMTAHAASPLMTDAGVIGLLHVDHGPGWQPMSTHDLDVLALFAEAAGHIVQRVLLDQRLQNLQDRVRGVSDALDTMVDEASWSPFELPLPSATAQAAAVQSSAAVPRVALRSGLTSVLTARELEVLQLMAAGLTNRAIGERLVVSEGTIKSHVKNILRKLHAANRAQAIARAVRIMHAGR